MRALRAALATKSVGFELVTDELAPLTSVAENKSQPTAERVTATGWIGQMSLSGLSCLISVRGTFRAEIDDLLAELSRLAGAG